jgi:hypothetical protein
LNFWLSNQGFAAHPSSFGSLDIRLRDHTNKYCSAKMRDTHE